MSNRYDLLLSEEQPQQQAGSPAAASIYFTAATHPNHSSQDWQRAREPAQYVTSTHQPTTATTIAEITTTVTTGTTESVCPAEYVSHVNRSQLQLFIWLIRGLHICSLPFL